MADPRFPPVQGAPASPAGGKLPILPIVLLVIYGLYIGVLIIAPALSEDLEATMDGFFPSNFRFIVGGILLGAFALILLVSLLDTGKRKGPALAAPGQEVKKFKPVQPARAMAVQPSPPPSPAPSAAAPPPAKEAAPPRPPAQPQKKAVITYPSDVEGGIYGETYIRLGQQKMLKLRSLVVEARYLD